MEVLREQALQQEEVLGALFADLERKISSGEKLFVRLERKPEAKDRQHSPDAKDPSAGFAAKDKVQTVFYLIDKVGESDCIYRYRPFSDYYSVDPDGETLRSPEIMMPFNLVAIRTQLKYYICRPDDLGIDASTPLPDYVELFSDAVKYYNEYLKNSRFPAFYRKLQPHEMKPNDAVVFKARLAAFKGEDIGKTCGLHEDLPEVTPFFSEHEVMLFICNDISPEDAADEKLRDESVVNEYRTCKSENAMIQKLMADPNLISEEERVLWDAVASQPNDARTLTVTFHFRRCTESLQIKPEAIREVILNRVSFKATDIAPSSRSTFFAMGAAPWSNGEKSTLTYEHIVKISYWDAVLYEKGKVPGKEKDAKVETRNSEKIISETEIESLDSELRKEESEWANRRIENADDYLTEDEVLYARFTPRRR